MIKKSFFLCCKIQDTLRYNLFSIQTFVLAFFIEKIFSNRPKWGVTLSGAGKIELRGMGGGYRSL